MVAGIGGNRYWRDAMDNELHTLADRPNRIDLTRRDMLATRRPGSTAATPVAPDVSRQVPRGCGITWLPEFRKVRR